MYEPVFLSSIVSNYWYIWIFSKLFFYYLLLKQSHFHLFASWIPVTCCQVIFPSKWELRAREIENVKYRMCFICTTEDSFFCGEITLPVECCEDKLQDEHFIDLCNTYFLYYQTMPFIGKTLSGGLQYNILF